MSKSSHGENSPLWAAGQAAGICGAAGLIVGGTIGIVRYSKTPVLWAVVSSGQWALLGGSYWGLRAAIIQSRKNDAESVKRLRLTASTLSGALSFAGVGAITRGRSNIIPGMIMGSLLGFAGQGAYNLLDRRHTEVVTREKKSVWDNFMSSEWNPVRKISNEEYANMLKERLLKVEAEMAVVEDDLRGLRRLQTEETNEEHGR